ncbi:cyclic nucleotide-binding domain-containing protein [Magnetococcus sp. PR-3]|uniref:cyclic nucleotide-binding domain-containing protein n=1 Tax=Magnetococcus sp. PR-3 TaxID=3120355 RepID=UPI002FCE20E1
MNSEWLFEKLKTSEIFSELCDDELKQIATFCQLIRIDKDQALIDAQKSEDNQALYLLIEGATNVGVNFSEQAESHRYQLHPIDTNLYGELAWLLKSKRTANVTCTQQSVAVRLDGEALTQWCQTNPVSGLEIMTKVSALLAKRVENLTTQMKYNAMFENH